MAITKTTELHRNVKPTGRKQMANSQAMIDIEEECDELKAMNKELVDALEELLEHVEWRRRVAGEVAGPNDCTHRARDTLRKARGL